MFQSVETRGGGSRVPTYNFLEIVRYSRQILRIKKYSLLQNEKVLSVNAKDGDVNNMRPIIFSIEQDILNYFSVENHGDGNASIITTSNMIDREDPVIVQMGGIYTFYIKVSFCYLQI